ncbi:MAG: hypothetical protein ACMXYE_04355 [Candidatus Woesearchaeota archaeon]
MHEKISVLNNKIKKFISNTKKKIDKYNATKREKDIEKAVEKATEIMNYYNSVDCEAFLEILEKNNITTKSYFSNKLYLKNIDYFVSILHLLISVLKRIYL